MNSLIFNMLLIKNEFVRLKRRFVTSAHVLIFQSSEGHRAQDASVGGNFSQHL